MSTDLIVKCTVNSEDPYTIEISGKVLDTSNGNDGERTQQTVTLIINRHDLVEALRGDLRPYH